MSNNEFDIDDTFYSFKSTDFDRAKREKSWKIRDTKSHPLCAFCSKRCFSPDIIGNKSLKKSKHWRGCNKFNLNMQVMMDYSDI
jgi:hypothetical protein